MSATCRCRYRRRCHLPLRPGAAPPPTWDRFGEPYSRTVRVSNALRYIARRDRKRLREPAAAFRYRLREGLSEMRSDGWHYSADLPGAQVALAQILQTGTLDTL